MARSLRTLRIEFEGALYHLTGRGNGRQRIFADEKDCAKFVQLLAASLRRYGIELHAYVLMGNHYHLVAETPRANLGRWMHWLITAYTVYFNRRHRRVGHLFQKRKGFRRERGLIFTFDIKKAYFNDNLLNTETNKYGDNIARTVTYTYDADGRRAGITYPNNAYSFTYAYTGRGQLDYIKDTANIINFNYFRDGTVYQRALDNGTNSFYGYDAMARVTSITHDLAGDTRTFGYDYDAVGNRKWVQRKGKRGLI